MNEESLQFAFIIHREMGCVDESSTDDEQAEKILFFYPPDLSVYDQLTKVNMLEGLIEFSAKFSSEPLDVVVMNNCSWAFFEAEQDVWIIVGVTNSVNHCVNASLQVHRPNGYGLQLVLKRLYNRYYTFFGSVTESIKGENDIGWKAVEAIQLARKQIRKLNLNLRQQHQDRDTLQFRNDIATSTCVHNHGEAAAPAEESIGVRADTTTAELVNADIAATQAEILVREKQLLALTSDPRYLAGGVRSALARFMKFHMTVSGDLLLATPSVFDGLRGISYSPLGSAPACNTALIRIRQALELVGGHQCTSSVLCHEGQVLWSDLDSQTTQVLAEFAHLQDQHAVRSRAAALLELCGGAKAKSNSSKFQVTDSELEEFVARRLQDALDGKKGFAVSGWETLDLSEDVTLNPLVSWGSTQETAGERHHNRPHRLTVPMGDLDVVCDHCVPPSGIFAPSVYTSDTCLGRVVYYRQNRFVLAVTVPQFSAHSEENVAAHSFLASAQQPNDRTCSERKNQVKVAQLLTHMQRSLDGGADSSAKPSNRFISPQSVQALLLVAFCGAVQQAVSAELSLLDRAISTAALHSPLDSSSMNALKSGKRSMPQQFSSPSTAGLAHTASHNPASGASSPTPGSSSGANTSSASLRDHKDIKVIFHNAISNTTKISGVFRGQISPLVSLPRETRDEILALLQGQDAHGRRVAELLSDKLRDEVDCGRFPYSSGVLASSLEPGVMLALSDIWIELAGRELCGHEPKQHNSAIEACLRVSTAQRGGVWVMGRCLSEHRYLYMVIDKCPTLNDMYEIFEDICEQLQNKSLIV